MPTSIVFQDLLNLITDENPVDQERRRKIFCNRCREYRAMVIKQDLTKQTQPGRSELHNTILQNIRDLNKKNTSPTHALIDILSRDQVREIIQAADL